MKALKSPAPPKLAVALLDKFVPGNDPLVGDLVEELKRGRPDSGSGPRRPARWQWCWSLARAKSGRYGSRTTGPGVHGAPDRIRCPYRRRSINISASPIGGIGGLGLVLLVALASLVVPGVWWVVAASVGAGLVLGLVLIAVARRRLRLQPPAAGANVLVMMDHTSDHVSDNAAPRTTHGG